MNTNELRAVRVAQGKSTAYMSAVIGKTIDNYNKKERGKVKFTPEEISLITNDLNLTPAKFNAIFFDSKLPFGKFGGAAFSEL